MRRLQWAAAVRSGRVADAQPTPSTSEVETPNFGGISLSPNADQLNASVLPHNF